MKNRLYIVLLMICVVFMSTGCSKVWTATQMLTTSTQDMIVEILEEKYPEKSFEVVGQEGLYYNVVDADGIEFQVEPIMSNFSRFWCTDNYLDAYFQTNGIVDQCNEVLERYGVENRVEIGETFEINLGVIDNYENCVQMAACLDELAELMKVPFEVTYYDKGTPQQGEEYKGSSKTGTFSYISLDYTFQEPHIMVSVGEGTISIEDIQNTVEGSDFLEGIIVQVNEYDAIGEALEPEFYVQLKEVVEKGERPVEVYGDDYRNFNISIEMIHAKITNNTNSSILEVKNDGKDEDGYTMLRVIAENGDEMLLHLGMNEGRAYSYKLQDLYMVD